MMNSIEQAEQFANVLDRELGIGMRFYESLDDFNVSTIEDGLRTYSVIGFTIGQPISVYAGGKMPKIVERFFPYDWEDEEIEENFCGEACIGFNIYPHGNDVFKVVPFVDYRNFDYLAYVEHEPFYWTLEEFTENKAQYTKILEKALYDL